MLGLSGEHLIVFTIVLLFFGPKTLPQLGLILGKTLRNLKGHPSQDAIYEPEFRHLEDKENQGDKPS